MVLFGKDIKLFMSNDNGHFNETPFAGFVRLSKVCLL